MSGKGQVVVPSDVRQRLGWGAGDELEVIEGSDYVTLRRPRAKGLSVQEAVARFRALYQHEGPPIPVEQLGWTADVDDDLA
ncbi:AbrB/MazE/SpoVT family DNA-binding domain-containing protein [Sphingomonas sp.]|uniref:AbrB/MazE/SpoVT family DNA-binding domain-containing protein n=1 Tax=Sphingomonas sp. TaxID=28214 RepID=UPI0035C87D16